MSRRIRTGLALAAYMATIPAANYAIGHIGRRDFPGGPHMLPVGFGFSAPSGVLLIGVGLAARDAVQRSAGIRAALCAIALGVGLSYLVNPAIATASAAAFLCGELVDLGAYTPLARRGHLPAAVAVSGVLGGMVDSFVFLQLAFGSTTYWQGQFVGKSIVALSCALLVAAWRAVSIRLRARQG